MTDPISRLNAALEGRYSIERELGEGGMATVYLAEDLKHERKVALKVLKPELAAVVGAERFLAEIKTTANLQHPNILPLFDSGEADSFLFYVMPFLEGESLRDRIDREAQLPVDEAVHLATAVLNGLQHAHDRGVIHRDIKPANLLLQDGQPVVADFGIALAVGVAGGHRLTETGLSVGTPFYMSPEQATGDQQVGPPSDVYALACVLYEALVGAPPFVGPTAQAILGQIIAGRVTAAAEVRPTIPDHVDAALRRALEKLPADRFPSASAFASALADPGFRYGSVSGQIQSRSWRTVALVSMAVALGTTALSAWLARRPPGGSFDVGLPFEAPVVFSGRRAIDLAPDGSFVVYEALDEGQRMLWYQSIPPGEVRPIQGTEGAYGSPHISPDGQTVAFVSDGEMFSVPLAGGSGTKIGEVEDPHGSWLDDGRIMVSDEDGRFIKFIDPRTQETQAFPSAYCLLPQLLPGRERVLCGGGDDKSAFLRSLDDPDPNAFSRVYTSGGEGGSARLLKGSDFRLVDEEYLTYLSADGSLRATRILSFDPLVVGNWASLVPGVRREAYSGAGQYDVSKDGTLVYVPGANAEIGQFVRVPGVDQPEPVLLPIDPEPIVRWAPSPDGLRMAVVLEGLQEQRLRIYDLATGSGTDWLTAHRIVQPRWSPSGDEIVVPVFEVPDSGSLILGSPNNVGGSRTLLTSRFLDAWPATYLDESTLLIGSGNGDPATVLDPSVDPVQTDTLDIESLFISIDPDGRYLVYGPDGGRGIYLTRYPDTRVRHTVSEAGLDPAWVSRTEFLYYVATGLTGVAQGVEWHRVTVRDSGGELTWNDEVWYSDSRFIETPGASYLPMPDGGMVYVQSPHATNEGHYIRVVPGWVEQMKAAVAEANR